MTGSQPKLHTRSIDGKDVRIETLEHEHGWSVVVTVPGAGPVEENDRTFADETAAVDAGEAIARDLLKRPAQG